MGIVRQFCPMEITSHCVVGLTWTLKDTLGEVLDTLEDPVEFVVGGHDLFKKIEEALQGHDVGAQIDLHLEPEEAFGDYNENLVFLENRALFPEEIEEGHTIEGHALPKGCNPEAPFGCALHRDRTLPRACGVRRQPPSRWHCHTHSYGSCISSRTHGSRI